MGGVLTELHGVSAAGGQDFSREGPPPRPAARGAVPTMRGASDTAVGGGAAGPRPGWWWCRCPRGVGARWVAGLGSVAGRCLADRCLAVGASASGRAHADVLGLSPAMPPASPPRLPVPWSSTPCGWRTAADRPRSSAYLPRSPTAVAVEAAGVVPGGARPVHGGAGAVPCRCQAARALGVDTRAPIVESGGAAPTSAGGVGRGWWTGGEVGVPGGCMPAGRSVTVVAVGAGGRPAGVGHRFHRGACRGRCISERSPARLPVLSTSAGDASSPTRRPRSDIRDNNRVAPNDDADLRLTLTVLRAFQ